MKMGPSYESLGSGRGYGSSGNPGTEITSTPFFGNWDAVAAPEWPRMFLTSLGPSVRTHFFRRRMSPGEPDYFPRSSGIKLLHIVPVWRRNEMAT